MIEINKRPAFRPGKILATPGCLAELEKAGQSLWEFVARHLACDYGDLSEEDRRLNDDAVRDGSRILSAYILKTGEKIWVITEAVGDNGHRECTTGICPSEY